MIRERADETLYILKKIRNDILILLAPITPFITESLWHSIHKKENSKKESVHLEDWPKPNKKKIDKGLEKEFFLTLKLLELGLAERDKAKLGLRWPLASAQITAPLSKELQDILARQLNVKKIILRKEDVLSVTLDTKITDELEAEGFAREIARKVQAERKNSGLTKGDPVKLSLFMEKDLTERILAYEEFLKERTNAHTLHFNDGKLPSEAIVFTVREKKIGIIFRT